MKIYEWKPVCDGEEHIVTLRYGRFTGKAIISIDGSEFDLSRFPLYYLKKRTQPFRLAEEKQALLVLWLFGTPDIVVDRKYIGSGKDYC